jgi:hypothetical protein
MRKIVRRRFFISASLFFLMVIVVTGSVVADDSSIIMHYNEYLKFCEESLLPNSMARQKGFDMKKHLKKVKAEKDKATAELNTDDARKYVEFRVAMTKDDIEKECATQLLKRIK